MVVTSQYLELEVRIKNFRINKFALIVELNFSVNYIGENFKMKTNIIRQINNYLILRMSSLYAL